MDIFAEIEIAEPTREDKGTVPLSSEVHGRQRNRPLVFPEPDPIRQTFYDMRGMAGDNPYTWNDARLFYRQAKFMADFTDDYAGQADFSMHSPCFQRMGYERLRTYFTWRTAVRRGEFPEIALSYIFLYVYELLACIGSNNPAGALAGLLSLRGAYAEKFPALDEYLPAWFRDFHVYYELPHSFAEFVRANNLSEFYTDAFAFCEGGLREWNKISAYDSEKSKFFAASEENAKLLTDCFDAAISGLAALCAKKNLRVKDLFFLTSKREIPWFPFRRAIFHPWQREAPDRRVELPGGEIFTCKSGEWTTFHTAPYAHKRDLAAFIIKKTEALARTEANFKTKISADTTALVKATAAFDAIGISIQEIDATIETAAANFFHEKNRIIVNVDTKNLQKIRIEADDITEKLIVEEETLGALPPIPPQGDAAPLTPIIGDGWADFAGVLNETEIQALRMVLDGEGGKIKAFADSKGLMLEILADGINEKAIDTIGDNVLDEDLHVYDEYADELRATVRL